mgnify:CR=1 FL=1
MVKSTGGTSRGPEFNSLAPIYQLKTVCTSCSRWSGTLTQTYIQAKHQCLRNKFTYTFKKKRKNLFKEEAVLWPNLELALSMGLPFSGSHWRWLNCSHWKAKEQSNKSRFKDTQEPPYGATLNVTPRWQWCTTQLLLLQSAGLFFHWVSLRFLFTDLQHQSSWMEGFIC